MRSRLSAPAFLLLTCLLLASGTLAQTIPEPCLSPFRESSQYLNGPFVDAICNSPERRRSFVNVTRGTIPHWLRGVFYRNVPAKYSFGEDQVQHWFDGMAQIQAYNFSSASTIEIHSKFQQTTTWWTLEENDSYPYVGFGTWPSPGQLFPLNNNSGGSTSGSNMAEESPSIFAGGRHSGRDRLEAKAEALRRKHRGRSKNDHSEPLRKAVERVGGSRIADGMVINNDVNLLFLAGRYFALSDVVRMIEWDGESLDTLTPVEFPWADPMSGDAGVSHGSYDAQSKEYFNYILEGHDALLGYPAKVVFWKGDAKKLATQNATSWAREIVGNVSTKNATYSHSLGLSKNFIVWMEQPIKMDILDLAIGLPPLLAMEDLSSTNNPVLHLISRSDGSVAGRFPILFRDASGNINEHGFGCIYHTGNVFEDVDGSVVYDAVRYPDCRVYDEFMLDVLLTKRSADAIALLSKGRLSRCRIYSVQNSSHAVCEDLVKNQTHGFPWYNKQFHMIPYRYAYTTVINVHGVTKIDLTTNETVAQFAPEGHLLTEAVFVPRDETAAPTATNEDDGALLTLAFNTNTKKSTIFAINATDFSEIFAVELPFGVPIHFHGIFCKELREGVAPVDRFCLWN